MKKDFDESAEVRGVGRDECAESGERGVVAAELLQRGRLAAEHSPRSYSRSYGFARRGLV